MSWPTRIEMLKVFCVLTLLAAGQQAARAGLLRLEAPWVEPPGGTQDQWNARVFQVVSAGHLPAVTDWNWIRVQQDQASTKVSRGKNASIYHDLKLISELDPAFQDAHVAGANLLSVIRDDIQGALDLLLRADSFIKNELPNYPKEFRERHWNMAWAVPMLLGYNYLFEFDQMPKAAVAFQEAAEMPGSPAYLQNLKDRLEKPGGQYEVGLRLLGFLIESASTEAAREKLERRRRSLYLSEYLWQLNRSFHDWLIGKPKYRADSKVDSGELNQFWARFMREKSVPPQDPFGGRIFLAENGKVESETPREKVFGLE